MSGNFTLISKNITNMYLAARMYRPDLDDYAAYAYRGVIANAQAYLMKGTISKDELKTICEVNVLKNGIIDFESMEGVAMYLTAVASEVMTLYFRIDVKSLDYFTIKNAVLSQRRQIYDCVYKTLRDNKPGFLMKGAVRNLLNNDLATCREAEKMAGVL